MESAEDRKRRRLLSRLGNRVRRKHADRKIRSRVRAERAAAVEGKGAAAVRCGSPGRRHEEKRRVSVETKIFVVGYTIGIVIGFSMGVIFRPLQGKLNAKLSRMVNGAGRRRDGFR